MVRHILDGARACPDLFDYKVVYLVVQSLKSVSIKFLITKFRNHAYKVDIMLVKVYDVLSTPVEGS